jgi:hypothetical protein
VVVRAVDGVGADRLAWLAEVPMTVRVWDIADPANPEQVGFYQVDPEHSVHNVVVRGTTAFAAWYVDGLIVLDLADPASPTLIDQWDTFTAGSKDPEDRSDGSQWPNVSGAIHVWPFGDVVAVSDQMRGLVLFDYFPPVATWGEAFADR